MEDLELCTLGGYNLARYRSTDVRCVVPLSQMASFFLVLFACDARADGRCPPGQYPVGGQGVGGCAPIPGGSSQATRPWGAIAGAASTGDMGASVGKNKEGSDIRGAGTLWEIWRERLRDRYDLQKSVCALC